MTEHTSKLLSILSITLMLSVCFVSVIATDGTDASTDKTWTRSASVDKRQPFSFDVSADPPKITNNGAYTIKSTSGLPDGVTATFVEKDKESAYGQLYNYIPTVNFSGSIDTPGTYNFDAYAEYKYGSTISYKTHFILTLTVNEIYYTLSVNASTGGTVTGGGTFVEGTSHTITATANNGYHFTKWNDNNTSNPRNVTLNGNASYTANFEINSYTVTYDGNGGTPSKSNENVNHGSSVTAGSATRSGYEFAGWYDSKDGGTKICDAGDVLNNITSNRTLYAHWTQITEFTSVAPTTTIVGSTYKYTPTANITGFNVGLSGNPSWLSVTNGQITGIAPASAENKDITFSVVLTKTGSTTATQEVTVHVYPIIEIVNPTVYIIAHEI